MVDDPWREFRRSIKAHKRILKEQIDRARREMLDAMKEARAEADRARTEFEGMMAMARKHAKLHPDWPRPEDFLKLPKNPKRRGRRRPGGGEPAPVKPRPKPKPLVDGAEAPID